LNVKRNSLSGLEKENGSTPDLAYILQPHRNQILSAPFIAPAQSIYAHLWGQRRQMWRVPLKKQQHTHAKIVTVISGLAKIADSATW